MRTVWFEKRGNRFRLWVSMPKTLAVRNISAEMFQWKSIGKRRREHTETLYAQQRWRRRPSPQMTRKTARMRLEDHHEMKGEGVGTKTNWKSMSAPLFCRDVLQDKDPQTWQTNAEVQNKYIYRDWLFCVLCGCPN